MLQLHGDGVLLFSHLQEAPQTNCVTHQFNLFLKAKDADHSKKSKRTPSFNIRRRTRSFKDKYKLPENLPPVDLQAYVDRKQELQSSGKKATIRSWKTFYTALYGQLLAFFKDQELSLIHI